MARCEQVPIVDDHEVELQAARALLYLKTHLLVQRCMISHAVKSEMESRNTHRGRQASDPGEIPPKGWWDIAMRVRAEMRTDNVSIIAAGLALYALLAVFPALAAAVSIYGLFASPADMAEHLQQAAGVLPQDAMQILQEQLAQLSAHPEDTLSIAIVIGIVLALWSARKGIVALMNVTNVAYDEEDQRGFFKQLLLSITFTLGAVLGFFAVLLLGVGTPAVLSFLPLGPSSEIVLLAVRWLMLFAIAVLGLTLLYRYAPDRHPARWKWITPGAVIAAVCWLLGSALFAIYVRNWGGYGETYGALGGVVVLLMWFYLSGYIVILGAEVNSEMERQTRKDTTTGSPKPMGARGAYSADTVGPSAEHVSEKEDASVSNTSENRESRSRHG